MKLLTILLLCSLSAYSKDYYVSNSGNDGNTGLTTSLPWKTISKVNAMFTAGSILAGDRILFKGGDRFDDVMLNITRSGSTSQNITIGSYGTGKAIFSGFVQLTGWTNVSGNIWQATPSKTIRKDVNILVINEVPQHVGRTNWMTYQSATATTLTSSSLTGTPNYTGAEAVIRKNTFIAERMNITSQSGSTITYTNSVQGLNNGASSSGQPGKAGNGFFLQRFAGSLDAQGEWYYDKTANKMQLYTTSNPNSMIIKTSWLDTVVKCGKQSNIRLENLSIEGANHYGVESYGASNVTVADCNFNANTKAVYIWNTNDATVIGCEIWNSLNQGIIVSNNQTKRVTVNNNIVRNTGQLIGNGVYNNDYSLRAIVARTSNDASQNYVNIVGNVIRSSGNAGIQFQGSNILVQNNVIDSFASQIDDMGGIYTFVANANLNTLIYTNRRILNNFISNAVGAPLGSAGGNIDVVGLYLDDQSGDIRCENNTISNIPGNGIQWNNPIRDTLIGNIVYNSEYAITVNVKQYGPVNANVIKGNYFYPLNAGQYAMQYTNTGLSNTGQTINQALASFANSDDNYFRMKVSAGFRHYYAVTQGGSYTFPSNQYTTIAQWRTLTTHETRSLEANVTPAVTLHQNPAPDFATIGFTGFSRKDPELVVYNNSATVGVWYSKLLIDNGVYVAPVNKPPSSNAGADQTITIPVTSVSVTGSGTDPEGTSLTYAWAYVSGPKPGNIITSGSLTTTINGMDVAGDYQYSFTTNDGVNTAISYMIVHVLPAIPPPNQPPLANAGTDVTMTLPANSTTLNGVLSTDPEGQVLTYSWAKISGPPATEVPLGNLMALTNLSEGEYIYELTVTDPGAKSSKARVVITVLPAPIPPGNKLPSASAGNDMFITQPVNSVTLVGSGADQDGTISNYLWSQISGPVTGFIVAAGSTSTKVDGLTVPGQYKFLMTVTDNSGGMTTDEVIVTVLASVVPTGSYHIFINTKPVN